MRVLLDTCIIMDAIQNRQPFAENAQQIFRLGASNWFIGCITAKSTAYIYYLVHKCTHSDKDTHSILSKLFSLFEVIDTAGIDCKKAVSSEVSDYEDAIMIESAIRSGVDCIVTRNIKDYKNSPVPVYLPENFLEKIDQEQNQP